jgi:hypothetical protein
MSLFFSREPKKEGEEEIMQEHNEQRRFFDSKACGYPSYVGT